jgi:type I site-specific restriction-modification system R (restriction) subunit
MEPDALSPSWSHAIAAERAPQTARECRQIGQRKRANADTRRKGEDDRVRAERRLRTIARDVVRHFVGRGFDGKAMVVSVDKATAVRMHDLVREEWEVYLAELRAEDEVVPEDPAA